MKKLKNTDGIIEFKNVSFSYNNEKFLDNLNFTINKNEITSIIGKNGIGKTTIINLILCIYKPIKGEILLDNTNINNIDKKAYLKEISVLNQDTYLFNLSIRDNFNIVNKNKEKQVEICRLIGIDEFINGLANGYDTIIDENSKNISKGQQRLISLARTLLKESKILILDEVESNIDLNTINRIINILKNYKKNHTIILITHKKEIIESSDKVIKIK